MSTGRFVPRTCEPPAPPQALPPQRRTSEATRIPKPAIRGAFRRARGAWRITMSTRRIGKRTRAQRTLLPLFEIGAYNVIGFCLAHGLA
jgi:hypothetical protein